MALDLSWVGTMVIVRVGYVRPVRLVHLRTNSGNKNYESREFGTTNAHESTRIKKRWSTKNTKDTKKNRVHPFVSFRAFRGQKRAKPWVGEQCFHEIRVGVLVQMLSTTDNIERAGTSEKIQPQINAKADANRSGTVDKGESISTHLR